jgi:D-3-phosphoglycerate dehydrogenase
MTDTLVVTDYDFPDLAVESAALAETDADVQLRGEYARTPEAVIDAAADADALLVQYAEITEAVFEALPTLRAIGRYGVGVDSVDLAAATDHGVTVVNVPDYCIEEVPTHTLALLLACVRQVPRYDRAVKRGEWDWTIGRPIRRLTGATIGLVGFGKLPRRLVELVAPFDLDVLVYDPYVDTADVEAVGAERVGLDELLDRSRYVSVHAPLTEETRRLIDADAFDRMREDAILINTARGELVDLDALTDAVEAGDIAGAGLDVLPEEPPSTPPLDHDDIIYTPHAAFYSETAIETMRRTVTEDVLGILRGEAPRNPVAEPGEN